HHYGTSPEATYFAGAGRRRRLLAWRALAAAPVCSCSASASAIAGGNDVPHDLVDWQTTRTSRTLFGRSHVFAVSYRRFGSASRLQDDAKMSDNLVPETLETIAAK